MVAQGEAEAPQLVPLGPGDAYSSQGEQCWGCNSWLSGKPPEGASGGWLCRWVSSMVIGSKARRRSISMLVPCLPMRRHSGASLCGCGLRFDGTCDRCEQARNGFLPQDGPGDARDSRDCAPDGQRRPNAESRSF
jgi:hypothetical protein